MSVNMVGKWLISVPPRSLELASSPMAGGSSIVDAAVERVLRLPVTNRLQNAPKRVNTNDTLLNHGVVNLTESNRRSTSLAISGWGITVCGTSSSSVGSKGTCVGGVGVQVCRPPLKPYTYY